MKNISEVTNCYGCLSCVDRCPTKCISVTETKLGHQIPHVDQSKCVECGACIKICPDITNHDLKMPLSVVAAWNVDINERLKSSSGGIATLIANEIINGGGVVYGCSFEEPFEFKHIRCENIASLAKLRGSKYVQSNTVGIYTKIRQDLKDNRKVLFIGTPCQVTAVNNYFNKPKNLFTVDLICHGVPSVKILKESIPKQILNTQITNVEFRQNTKYQFSLLKGRFTLYNRPIATDLYLKAFFTGLDYRESCYKCRFAHIMRSGDITLGDFWGLKLKLPVYERGYGVSLCLINSEKGYNLLRSTNKQTKQHIRSLEEAVLENQPLVHPKKKTFRVRLFNCLYPHIGFRLATICAIPEIYIKSKIIRY
ncbi:4Fe-4S dicluster domain-containing protein [Muribaculum intestinale]|uniref:Coenzyme F420 hydrogenase/dehydrogenase, beta subunit C-terminal domain n=1 Tax=Muribaculum intestinale TaxID=1796646 RepID=UPI001093C0B5|nr:Coenzyme F420 hydrogenase/dehydrogenase, beta subunit C-terminal domain [Muribaculum intestinale]TGX82533.1 4Fe-4S dicluster domain-containing protein [Muribaculum intestinale]